MLPHLVPLTARAPISLVPFHTLATKVSLDRDVFGFTTMSVRMSRFLTVWQRVAIHKVVTLVLATLDTSLAEEVCVPMSTNAQKPLTIVMPGPPVPTRQGHSHVFVTTDSKVTMARCVQMWTSAPRTWILAPRKRFVLITLGRSCADVTTDGKVMA